MIRAKGIVAVLVVATAAILVSTAVSGPAPPPGNGGASASDTIGDHPPTTSFLLKGKIGVTVSALPYDALPNPAGTFNVSGIPTGAKVLKALLYLTDWQAASASATFAGAPFGPSAPVTTDPGGDTLLGIYRFDVTGRVKHNGTFDYTSSGIAGSYVSALVIVYKSKTLLSNTIWINDGAENMCCETNSTSTFTHGSQTASDGRLLIVTGADDNIGKFESDEVISLNGQAVGGPIDGNLGNYASLFDLAVTGVVAKNTVNVTTHGDWFGWHLAILSKQRQ